MRPFDAVPLWLLALLLFAALLAAAWLGTRLQRGATRDDDETDEGYILSAALGLLALLVAFTYGMALDRHEQRRAAVVAEANAVGTAWLRADLLPQPEQARARALLQRYVAARLALAGDDPAALTQARADAARLQGDYWRVVIAASRRLQPDVLDGAVLQSANELIDAAGVRHAAIDARVPRSVLAGVILYALIAALLMGYAMGVRAARQRAPAATLFLLLTLAIALIFDLDRPRTGTIVVSQQPFRWRSFARRWPRLHHLRNDGDGS